MATKTPAKAKPKATKPKGGASPAGRSAFDEAMANFEATPGKIQEFVAQSPRKVVEAQPEPAPSSSGGGVRDFLTQRVSTDSRPTRLGRPTSAPSTSFTSAAPATEARFNKATVSRITLLAMGISGAAIIINGKDFQPYEATLANGNKTKVPGNMRAFAGVVIAGTVTLIVNEVLPDVAMVMAVGLVFVAFADVKVFSTLGGALFGKPKPVPQSSGKSGFTPQGGGAGGGGGGGGGGSW